MSKDPGPAPSASRLLSAEEQARVLGKLRRLETVTMFTPEWERMRPLVHGWLLGARMGRLQCQDVSRIAAEFARWGVG